ncbi:MAG: hypothetical protein HY735_29160 [Verrucomicrobia bacterium]|nr:hypothetical protein [Verrucomicrobiota bacterium]
MNASSATPKQVAYLSYMGIQAAQLMSKEEASEAIDKLFNTEDFDLCERLRERQSDWITDRFILYPDLYASEIQRMLEDELPQMLHAYVRSRVVGASEKLTKAKIKQVIAALTQENAQWWQAKNKKDVFFVRLTSTFPSCVDGRSPEKKPVPRKPIESAVIGPAKGSGCLIMLCAFIAVAVLILLTMTHG